MLKTMREARERGQFEEDPEQANRPRVRGGADHIPVSTIMTRAVISASPETSLETATQLMFENGIARLPVLDAEGKLVGLLSYTDLAVQAVEGSEGQEVEPRAVRVMFERGLVGGSPDLRVHEPVVTVGERMSKRVMTISETDTVAHAASLMSVHHVHGLPVLKGERLVGVVSSLDIAAWVAGLS